MVTGGTLVEVDPAQWWNGGKVLRGEIEELMGRAGIALESLVCTATGVVCGLAAADEWLVVSVRSPARIKCIVVGEMEEEYRELAELMSALAICWGTRMGSTSAKKNSVVTRYISRCALYTPHFSSFVSWRPAFSFPPCPPSHFTFRPIHALSTSTFHLSPCPHPHLPARPIHTHTSTFLSSLCTISASY